MPRLHIAVIDEEFPFPLTSGKRIRTFNLLSRLSLRHRITYLAYPTGGEDDLRIAMKGMRDRDIRPIAVNYRVPAKSGIGFQARVFRNLFSPLPYSVVTHSSAAMAKAIDRLLAEDRPDLWQCEWTPYAEAMHGRALPWIVMAHNVESQIWRRSAAAERNPLKKFVLSQQARKFDIFEEWSSHAANRTVAVSEEDAAHLRTEFKAERVSVVENGVDSAFFAPDSEVRRDPRRILFLGSLDWRPNQDAVRVMLNDIFPRVRKAEPETSLFIVGRQPPEWLRTLANRPGVELHADVPDVRLFLQGAGMLAVPLRIGGGSRLKILEALATGTPVVSTTVGAEGLRLHGGKHLTIADTVPDFAAAVIDGIRHPERLREEAFRGRVRTLAEYEWAGLADKLETVWQSCAVVRKQEAPPPKPPAKPEPPPEPELPAEPIRYVGHGVVAPSQAGL